MQDTLQRLNQRLNQRLLPAYRTGWTLLHNSPAGTLLPDRRAPAFVFATYGHMRDIDAYCHPRLRPIVPRMCVLSTIRLAGRSGLVVGTQYPEQELEASPARIQDYLNWLRRMFPGAGQIALAGRLPTLALKAGIALAPPFVNGALGTRFLVTQVGQQLLHPPGQPQQTSLVVLGGAGRIGTLACDDLRHQFSRVIAFDPRHVHEQLTCDERGSLLLTANPERLQDQRLFLALLPRGEALRELLPALPDGALIADDTHPGIPRDLRAALSQRRIRVLKAVLSHRDFGIHPPMPGWKGDQIPGCLVEALVRLQHPRQDFTHKNDFIQAALALGFHGRLVPPPAA